MTVILPLTSDLVASRQLLALLLPTLLIECPMLRLNQIPNRGALKCYKLRQYAAEYAAGLLSTEATPIKNTAHVNVKY